MAKELWVLMGADIEYNDSTYDIVPSGQVIGVFTTKAVAEAARKAASAAVSQGWSAVDIEESSMEDAESVQEAVFRRLLVTHVEVETGDLSEAYMVFGPDLDEDGYGRGVSCRRIVGREEVFHALGAVRDEIMKTKPYVNREYIIDGLLESIRLERLTDHTLKGAEEVAS